MQSHPPAYALKGASLIDGTGQPPLPNAAVLVQGRQIVRVGQEEGIEIPSGVRVYDVRGKTLMPGLIDGHVHLRSYAGEGWQDIHLWNVLTFIEEQTLHAAANAGRALEAGVTTVRDMAGGRPEISVKHAVDGFVLPGARVVASGFVGMIAGHGDMFVPPNIEQRMWQTADGPDECRKLVRQYARDGVDFIKICTSGGVLSLGDRAEWHNFTLDETRAIVGESHDLGMRVAAHAHTHAGILQALQAGVDTIEHGTCLDDELIDLMLAKGAQLCPTLAISEYMLANGEARGVPAESLEKGKALALGHLEAIQAAYRAGVPIFMGTDSCNTMTFGLHAWELELLQSQIQMSAMDAILAATSTAAEALGLGDRIGTLEPGKWADMIVVDGDPLTDITVLQDPTRIQGVYRDGKLLVNRGMA